jgi:hypothetical protein
MAGQFGLCEKEGYHYQTHSDDQSVSTQGFRLHLHSQPLSFADLFQLLENFAFFKDFIPTEVPELITFQRNNCGAAGKNSPEVGIHITTEMIEKKEGRQIAKMRNTADFI